MTEITNNAETSGPGPVSKKTLRTSVVKELRLAMLCAMCHAGIFKKAYYLFVITVILPNYGFIA